MSEPDEPKVHVIIGLGGVGGLVMRLLAPYLWYKNGDHTIIGVDGDEFEHKNKARMAFTNVGPKSKVLCDELRPIYETRVELTAKHMYADEENIGHIIREEDIVFCCPDNHKTRRLVELRCQELDDVALFSGGNDGVEGDKDGTFGNVQAYLREGGKNVTNPISLYHPEIRDPRDKMPHEVGCLEQANSAPQLVFTNAQVAVSLLSAYYAWERGALGHEEAYLNIETGRVQPVVRKLRSQ